MSKSGSSLPIVDESQISIFNTESDLHQRCSVKASGLALLGIVVTIDIVAEHCECLTISIMDHFPPINIGWPVAKTSVMAPFCSAKKRCEGTVL